ncbi:MAG: hypothetical protein R3261_06950 [Alphaproteobacteria bacterium]|nr:hypothetical protein [Alphaproteobacteria bacterium]
MQSSFYGYGGISDTLAGIFEALADQEGLNGRRYRSNDVWTLLGDVAERRFASGIYELCHLLRAFGQLDRRGEAVNIFWQADPATPTAFRYMLEGYHQSHGNTKASINKGGLVIEPGRVELSYHDHKPFEVKSGRMPYLAALFDFLVNAIGYDSLENDLKTLTKPDLSHKDLSSISNGLFSSAYSFLSDHLPTSQGQKKMRLILTFLNDVLGEGFDLSDIRDETILAFWQGQDFNVEGAGDFIRYSTVFDDFTRFSQSVREVLSKRNVVSARVIGYDVEAGEVNPEDLGDFQEGFAEEAGMKLARLSEEPLEQIKFLAKKDSEYLADIVDRADEISRWALSFLRAKTFGQGQARITQALRNKVDASRLKYLCEDSSPVDYDEYIAKDEKLARSLKNTQMACLFAASSMQAKQNNEEMLTLDFQMMGKARKAFHNINRQGFQEAMLEQPEMADLFEDGADCLIGIDRCFSRILEAIQQVEAKICYDEDKPRFAESFYKIYGGHG